jgi:sec-independent protein translocase protein TatC
MAVEALRRGGAQRPASDLFPPPEPFAPGDEAPPPSLPVPMRPAPPAPPAPPADPPEDEREELPAMSLLEHLEELRKRLMWCVATVGTAFGVCWYFCEPIFHFLARPIYQFLPKGQKLVILSVADAFLLYIKVAAIAAVFASAPVLLFHLWRFIQPGLYKRERRYAFGFVISGTVLFMCGGAFAYYVAFPFAVQFLLGVGHEFTAAITGESYLSFLLTVIVGLGLMFELPVVMVFLSRVGLVTPRFFMRHFRHAVVIIFIAAAIITPTPDVFNLCLFAVPTLVLYLLGVAVAALLGRRSKAAEDAALGAAASAR